MSTRAGYAKLLSRRYSAWGIDVTVTNPCTGQDTTLRMIDLTRGVEIGDSAAEVSTVAPTAAVRKAELTAAELEPRDMIGLQIELNGANWAINSHAPKPGPFGAEDGEVYFMLVECHV